jgi:hypothetical protein
MVYKLIFSFILLKWSLNHNFFIPLVANKLKVSYLMGNENAYSWHGDMCQIHTLVAK